MLINEVIKRMRYLTDNGIPFSFEYISYNQTKKTSTGLVQVASALLRPNMVSKSDTLVAFTDLLQDKPKFFHLPLIVKFNDKLVINEY